MGRRGRAGDVRRDPEKDYYEDPAKVRLGSRPFRAGVIYYIVRNEAYLLPTTISENARKLYYFADTLQGLKAEGKVKTTDPRHMKTREIEAMMIWMRGHNLAVSTRSKYLRILDSYLVFWNNHVIKEMKARRELDAFLKGQDPDIEFIEEEDLRRIFQCVDEYPGYEGILLRGYFALIFGAAGRPKEIIDALVEDIDIEQHAFFIRHPKAEGSWGRKEWIPIVREDMFERVQRFLVERRVYLAAHETDSEYLFVNLDTHMPYSNNTIRNYKVDIEMATGVNFQLKAFRSSYATLTYSHAPEMKGAISKQLRHSNEGTTEKYYIAYTRRQAAARLKDEWKKSKM